MWNLEGMQVEGIYLSEAAVSGKVTLSRVCYGGGVTHHVAIDKGFFITAPSGQVIIRREAGDVVIIEHKHITKVRD